MVLNKKKAIKAIRDRHSLKAGMSRECRTAGMSDRRAIKAKFCLFLARFRSNGFNNREKVVEKLIF